ncbi:hypothetical protein D9757_012806 [Collybiopsis confluens]|uniref:DUF659 domain-containing protein n=1 Tax=Collybiopsis confluens TaxID=2823264 RepID=A0A8H5LQP3_9AGAR|nr:hypothetical protein D9757_012806 [Collybiopsis confluens]
MGKSKGEMWQYFWQGAKANSSQYRAICLGCIRHHLGKVDLNDSETVTFKDEDAFKNACIAAGSVLGEKNAMIAHILGGEKLCRYASNAAAVTAKGLRKKIQDTKKRGKRERDDDSGNDEEPGDDSEPALSKRRKAVDWVEKRQTKLKVFKGISIPFSDEEEKTIHAQFTHATISANLPFQWVEDPEIIKLFLMFRSCAGSMIPSRKMLAGRLLKEEEGRVEEELKATLKDQNVTLTCDAVKDISKDSLMGVAVSAKFKPYLVDLYNATAERKDGDAVDEALGEMIDKTETNYKCTVVAVGTDNDGGMRSGRGKLGTKRPWVMTFPCGGHQGHLTGGDYFKVSPEAEEISAKATDLIGWLNNHGRVRCTFNNVQIERTGQVKSHLVANTTRWTTHLVAFLRLDDLKQSLRMAAITQREAIISAQVGAEKNFAASMALRTAAEEQLDVIEDNSFWRNLSVVIDDLEPIGYATNICQSDKARPDVVLLAFAGMFLHFRNLPPERSSVSKGMMKRLERRWAGFDQALMVTALILNPYERLDRFGPDAGANIMNVRATVVDLYSRVKSRPPPLELDPEQLEEWENKQMQQSREFSTAFLQYCSSTGPFKNWDELKSDFEKIHKEDPSIFWESMKADRALVELAEFALIIAENLRAHQKHDGLRDERQARKNHADDRIGQLLQVPRYADISQDNDQTTNQPALVTNRRKWRAEVEQWKRDAEKYDEEFGSDPNADLPLPETQGTSRQWLPRSLALLFGGAEPVTVVEESADNGRQPRRARRSVFTEEQLLMELLAQEQEDEIADDGALEGSGDEYSEN